MLKSTLTTFSLLAAFSIASTVHAEEQSSAYQTEPNQMDQKQGKKPHKRPVFSDLDLDGNGSITLEEFKQHKVPHGRHEKAFGHIDSNGDSLISEEELTNHKPPRHHHQGKQANN
jgi:Ca2+-binding EF-hand superfamily protein